SPRPPGRAPARRRRAAAVRSVGARPAGRAEVRGGGAAAAGAAQPLPDRRLAQRDRGGGHVGGDVAGPPGPPLGAAGPPPAELAGGQEPQWTPSCATKTAGSGCRAPGEPSPSIVRTSSPSCITASVRQALIRRPLTSIVLPPTVTVALYARSREGSQGGAADS